MKAVMLIAFLLLASCLKTEEVLITHFDLCEGKKHLADNDDYRDPYDSCLMEKEQFIKSVSGCEATCKDFCKGIGLKYQSMWVDFSGCHCYCERKLR